MDNKDFNSISEEVAQGLLDAVNGMNEALGSFEDVWKRHHEMLINEVKAKCAEKLVFYADKYAQATFFTRWYWKRKMKKFVKGIDVLKEL